jgi:protein O-mannosyl-transferase
VMLCLVVFGQVRNYAFVNYDDSGYVSENPQVQVGLNYNSIIWAFKTGHIGNWHPVTWLSLMLDSQLFHNNIGWFHVTSLLLHIANTLLLFWVLNQMTGGAWKSAFVAALFAVHPLHVESVAWISERKDVLSTLFWILTMLLYVRYVKRSSIIWYLLAMITFTLGLMSKPMLVTLPCVLLLLDFWPLQRFQNTKKSRLILEKIPFFAITAASSVVTFFVQKSGGYMMTSTVLTLPVRLANAAISYISYIEKMFWPAHLAVFYPHPLNKVSYPQAVIAAVLLLVITVWLFRLSSQYKYLIVGWLWYLGTLVPVIGIIQVGDQAIADRYTYVPLIGLFIMIAWGIPELFAKLRYPEKLPAVFAIIVILILSMTAFMQTAYWRNSITLFEHAIAVTKDNNVAHFCIAGPIAEKGNIDSAIWHLRQALQIRADDRRAHNQLGVYLLEKGKPTEAVSHFQDAIKLDSKFTEAYNNLCVAYNRLGKFDKSIEYGEKAIKIAPNEADSYFNLGIAFYQKGNLDQAVRYWRETVKLNPKHSMAMSNLGAVLYQMGNKQEAVKYLQEAVRLNPNDTSAQSNLRQILSAK